MLRIRPLLLLGALVLASCNLGGTPSPEETPTVESAPEITAEAVSLLVSPPPDAQCDQLITTALQQVGEACAALDRNQACYGNQLVEAEFASGAQPVFAQTGDLVELSAVRRLRTASLDTLAQQWGIAIIKAQANLPNSLPGQNVTFLLFGDAQIDNPTPQMRAVTISTGVGTLSCDNAPPSAVMIQSPEGTRVTVTINGAEITLASTIYLTANAGGSMTVATLEGAAEVEAFGRIETVVPGTQVRVPLDAALEASGPPSEPEPMDETTARALPVSVLDRPVQIPPAFIPPTGSAPPRTTVTASRANGACVPPAGWTQTYTVRAGDTLMRIARQFSVDARDLQQGNCITNADLITAGQVLYLPPEPTETPPPTDTPIPSATPDTPDLRADSRELRPGECTILRWDITDASEVYFEGQQAEGIDTREVCPTETTTYTLVVVYEDGRQEPYRLTVIVNQPAA